MYCVCFTGEPLCTQTIISSASKFKRCDTMLISILVLKAFRFKLIWLFNGCLLLANCSLFVIVVVQKAYTFRRNISTMLIFHCREHIKEKFLNDLRKIREQHTGEALAKVSIIPTFWGIRIHFYFWIVLLRQYRKYFSSIFMCRPWQIWGIEWTIQNFSRRMWYSTC